MMMALQSQKKYEDLSNEQLVEMILAQPHDEEAATYLIYQRYYPLTHSLYVKLYKKLSKNEKYVNMYWYDDCKQELYVHLKGKNGDWHPLETFGWRCTLGSWLKSVSYNLFKKYLRGKIDSGGKEVPLDTDNEDSDAPPVQLPDGGEEEFERRQRKVMLLEAIGQLKNKDQKFVILKRLEGYSSKEIAILLQKKWAKQGIMKYNKDNNPVIPDEAYVDVCVQRAKANLKNIIVEL